MALRKPSDFFHRSQDNNQPQSENSDSPLREEIDRAESLSREISKLQQEIYQKTVENDAVLLFKEQVNEI